jgi:tRNA dimethylallyltransferase
VETLVDPLLIVILGPTASGKTSLSLALAEQFQGEIVSCDSVTVYRGLEVGSAKPTAAERERIPHHLLDVADPSSFYTAGDYSRDARVAIAEINRRNKLPIVTGGAGLYLRALLQGLFAGPQRSQALRERLEQRVAVHGAVYLHRILKRLDPVSATRIHANDVPKVIRAIEVSLAASQPMSEAWQQGSEPLTGYRILRIGLNPPRDQLYARINARARDMFTNGLVEETRQLIARYGRSPALNSLGYRQAADFLEGHHTLDEAIAEASQGHRNYAKRQLTWFRREPAVSWLGGFGDDFLVRQEAGRVAQQLLYEAKS